VLRLVRSFLDRGLDVQMLSRRNGIPWYVNYDKGTTGVGDALAHFEEHIRSFLPEEDRGRISVSTTHRYKGLEQLAVIVLDAIERSYPLINPNWVFLRIFGDSIGRIEDEERRLFYVAVTRARESLALVTEARAESPYLGEICRQVPVDLLQWDRLAPVPSLDTARLEIRVFGPYLVMSQTKDQLKDRGYQFIGEGRYWRKAMLADGFSFEALLSQPWARSGVRIEVYSEAGELLHRR
jgi:DNA helicase-4